MKENDFPKPADPPALVQAFLELDDGSDEEFLDFQFRIADATANLRERDTSDHMADWKASFASLQLKQAHEVAEFALARRREDESRIDRQAKEILLLRKTLEASKLETEQVKAMCAVLNEEKLRLAEELAHQYNVCETFRASTTELCEVQERVSGENTELKRSLDEAIATTGRLKVALEKKAAELAAWLGQEGGGLQGMSFSSFEKDLSPEVPGKQENFEQIIAADRSEEGQEIETHPVEDQCLKESAVMARDLSEEGEGVPASSIENASIAASKNTIEALNKPVDVQSDDDGTSNSPGSEDLVQEKSVLHGESPGVLQSDACADSASVVPDMEDEKPLDLHEKIMKLQPKRENLQDGGSELDIKQLDTDSVLTGAESQSSIEDSFAGVCGVQIYGSSLFSTDQNAEVVDRVHRASTTKLVDDMPADVPFDKLSAADLNEQSSVESDSAACLPTNATLKESKTDPRSLFDTPGYSDTMIGDSRNDLEDKYICVSPSDPSSVNKVANLVESISEELVSMLSVIVPTLNTSRQNVLTNLDERVKSWSFLTRKTLQSKVSTDGAIEEWKNMVVDFLGLSRQGLIELQQRLQSCESELSFVDKLQAECLAAGQTIALLKDEVQKLEEQNFSDQIESEEELNLLKVELQHAQEHQMKAERNAVEEQRHTRFLRDQLGRYEKELESSKSGRAAEEDFIDSFLSCANEELSEDDLVSRSEMKKMEKKLEDLMIKLEENERELGELLIIGGADPDAVLCAKIRRLERKLEDAKQSEEILTRERAQLLAATESLKARVTELEYELHLENEQHVEMLIEYEEERGQWPVSSRSEKSVARSLQVEQQLEQQLAEKTKRVELMEKGVDFSPSQTQLLALQARVVTLENKLAVTRQKAVDCEAAISSQINKEKEKCAQLEAKCSALETNYTILKTRSSECEQRERRAQSTVDKLMVELGIAKEEVLRYEVRLQKTFRQAREELEAEKRKHEETINTQKQMEWHLCRQLELTEGLEKEKAKIREVLVDFEMQNMALQKENDNLRAAYIQLARQADQRGTHKSHVMRAERLQSCWLLQCCWSFVFS